MTRFSSSSKNNYFIHFYPRITANEKKLISYILMQFKITKAYSVSVNFGKISDFLGMNAVELTKLIEKLMNKKIKYFFGNVLGYTSIFSSVLFEDDDITFFFPNELIKSLDIKSIFYSLDFSSFLLLEYNLSTPLFLFILEKRRDRKRENINISLKDLKSILLVEKSYERFYDFERHVLKKIIDDINRHSVFEISYEKVRENSRINSININITEKSIPENNPQLDELLSFIKDDIENFSKISEIISENIEKKGFEITKEQVLFSKENYNSDFDEYLNLVFNEEIDIKNDIKLSGKIEKRYENFHMFQSDIIKELKKYELDQSPFEYLHLSYELYDFFHNSKRTLFTKDLGKISFKIMKMNHLFLCKLFYKK